MFETDDFGHFTDKLAAILDWQCLHEGNWLFDLVRLMICNLDGDIRREMETFIFDFYLDRLHFHLKENGHQEKVAFSAKQVKEAYETLFLGHMDHATCMPGGLLSSRGRNLETDAVEAARVDRCTLRAIHVLEDAQKLINSGRFDKWL
uniref:Uncharacterized protein n=1 Tax=Panagrolaimus sp. JU765 TaxID=591449 RepID=A0AC34RJP3_9BILA